MRFQTESYQAFRFAAAWALSYKIETTAPWYGYAYIIVNYILYDDYMSSAIETHSYGWSRSCHTDWFGVSDSESGFKNMNADDYVQFNCDLDDETWYNAAVQLS
ncbi:MAG: hypothetical protein EAX81_05805 [Candidatus Thorarchaeota archaeon]|nr:hypothetical protein [Candidatus Thorarchaeota archaeon]